MAQNLPGCDRQSSIKKALDIDWNEAGAKAAARTTFSRQLDALQSWIEHQLLEEVAKPPLKEQVATLVQIRRQDLEPDPHGGVRIRAGGRSARVDRGLGDAARPQEQE